MRRARFSIGGLMILVAATGVGSWILRVIGPTGFSVAISLLSSILILWRIVAWACREPDGRRTTLILVGLVLLWYAATMLLLVACFRLVPSLSRGLWSWIPVAYDFG